MILLQRWFKKHWFIVTLVVFYLVTHLLSLTLLPVFADEAIYIRWAQLILDDWQRYLFFPLNDGKTPLHMWLMVPLLAFLQDQLFAGRLLSVLVGLGQLLILAQTLTLMKVSPVLKRVSLVLVCVLPFWYFHHRMALIDGLLTLWLSLAFLGMIKLKSLIVSKSKWSYGAVGCWTVLTGVAVGAAFYTKLPALFFLPVFGLTVAFELQLPIKWKQLSMLSFVYGFAISLGVLCFLTIKLHPAFGQLFARGGDFTFSLQEILTTERHTPFTNGLKLLWWLSAYLSPFAIALPLWTLIAVKPRKQLSYLLLAGVGFALPLLLFGKVLAPRYFLPTAFFFTLAFIHSCDLLMKSRVPIFQKLTKVIMLATFVWSVPFVFASSFKVASIPFVHADETQYLTEWSAGFGNREVTNLLLQEAKSNRIIVATEGYFGTLPDGILMDLHNQDVTNVEVFGIGVPVNDVPDELIEKIGSDTTTTVWIVVNSHRMTAHDDRLTKKYSFARPRGGPSLDVYEFTH